MITFDTSMSRNLSRKSFGDKQFRIPSQKAVQARFEGAKEKVHQFGHCEPDN